MNTAAADPSHESGGTLERRIAALLGRMTLAAKIGQMNQLNAEDAAAGVDMDMAGGVYAVQLARLVDEGRVHIDLVEAGAAGPSP